MLKLLFELFYMKWIALVVGGYILFLWLLITVTPPLSLWRGFVAMNLIAVSFLAGFICAYVIARDHGERQEDGAKDS